MEDCIRWNGLKWGSSIHQVASGLFLGGDSLSKIMEYRSCKYQVYVCDVLNGYTVDNIAVAQYVNDRLANVRVRVLRSEQKDPGSDDSQMSKMDMLREVFRQSAEEDASFDRLYGHFVHLYGEPSGPNPMSSCVHYTWQKDSDSASCDLFRDVGMVEFMICSGRHRNVFAEFGAASNTIADEYAPDGYRESSK